MSACALTPRTGTAVSTDCGAGLHSGPFPASGSLWDLPFSAEGLASSCSKTWLPCTGVVEPGQPLLGFDHREGGTAGSPESEHPSVFPISAFPSLEHPHVIPRPQRAPGPHPPPLTHGVPHCCSELVPRATLPWGPRHQLSLPCVTPGFVSQASCVKMAPCRTSSAASGWQRWRWLMPKQVGSPGQ